MHLDRPDLKSVAHHLQPFLAVSHHTLRPSPPLSIPLQPSPTFSTLLTVSHVSPHGFTKQEHKQLERDGRPPKQPEGGQLGQGRLSLADLMTSGREPREQVCMTTPPLHIRTDAHTPHYTRLHTHLPSAYTHTRAQPTLHIAHTLHPTHPTHPTPHALHTHLPLHPRVPSLTPSPTRPFHPRATRAAHRATGQRWIVRRRLRPSPRIGPHQGGVRWGGECELRVRGRA